MTTMTTAEREQRLALSRTAGLTKAQIQALLDPTMSLRLGQILIEALTAKAAAKFEAKPEAEKEMARAFRRTEHVVTTGVTYDAASGRQ